MLRRLDLESLRALYGTGRFAPGDLVEVVQAVGAKLGKTVEFVQTPFDSIFA